MRWLRAQLGMNVRESGKLPIITLRLREGQLARGIGHAFWVHAKHAALCRPGFPTTPAMP